jgi:hypothetical protein
MTDAASPIPADAPPRGIGPGAATTAVAVTIVAFAALEAATLAAVLMVLIGLGLVAYSLHVWSRRTLARTLHRFHDLYDDGHDASTLAASGNRGAGRDRTFDRGVMSRS